MVTKPQRSLLSYGFSSKRGRENVDDSKSTQNSSTASITGKRRNSNASEDIESFAERLERLQSNLLQQMSDSRRHYSTHNSLKDRYALNSLNPCVMDSISMIFPVIQHVNFVENDLLRRSDKHQHLFRRRDAEQWMEDSFYLPQALTYNNSFDYLVSINSTKYEPNTHSVELLRLHLKNYYDCNDNDDNYGESGSEYGSDEDSRDCDKPGCFYHIADKSIQPTENETNRKNLNCVVMYSSDANNLSPIVLAAAKEQELDVIELGPDSRRSSLDLLNELAESTKSHSIHNSRDKRHSLVFLSQVDILYEQDQGFWNALLTIVERSKRMVILSCSDLTALPKKVCDLLDTGRKMKLLTIGPPFIEDINLSSDNYNLEILESEIFEIMPDFDSIKDQLEQICYFDQLLTSRLYDTYWVAQPLYSLSLESSHPADYLLYKAVLFDNELQLSSDHLAAARFLTAVTDSLSSNRFSEQIIDSVKGTDKGLKNLERAALAGNLNDSEFFCRKRILRTEMIPLTVQIFRACQLQQRVLDPCYLEGRSRRSRRLRERDPEPYLSSLIHENQLADNYISL